MTNFKIIAHPPRRNACCQFCGGSLPQNHPQAITIDIERKHPIHFTAVCADCWEQPQPYGKAIKVHST